MTLGDDAGPRMDVVSRSIDHHRASDVAASSGRTRLHRGQRPFVVFVLVLLIVAIVALFITRLTPRPPVKFPPGALSANFGLSRSSLTRSIVVSSGSVLSPAPSVLVARVASDLVQASGISQFPADQITLTASPVGAQSVQIVATLNPMNPEKVGDGLFTGMINVYTGSKRLVVPLAVYLTPKSGVRAGLAFSLLLLGAVLGLSVKWITEALSDLAAAQSRFERLRSGLGDSKSLPDNAKTMLDEIYDRIRSQDIGRLDELFGPLERDRQSLRTFSMAVEQASSRIREQERISEQEPYSGKVPALRLIKVIVDRERTKVRDLQSTPWPWKDSEEEDDAIKKARDLSRQSLVSSIALSAPDQFEDVLYSFQCDKFDEAEEKYLHLRLPEVNAESPTVHRPVSEATVTAKGIWARLRGHLPRPQLPELLRGAKSPTQWMTERPRAMAGAASVLVVAIVGLQVQYMNSTSFTGSLSDWLTLLLWAAIIELSGVSLLDVVGRLGGGRTVPQK